jgi:hypothetical protein
MDGLRKLLDEATPAPWNIGGRKNPKSGGAVAMVNSPLWESFARVVVRFDDEEADDAGGLANARLIAMAPDLAAALLKAEEALANIASQKKTDEIETEYEAECADFEAGFDTCVDVARSALTEIRKLTGAA